ncbi:hypothetical protein [Roseateles sp.]|nr:hypothetical protein [Roseateles sp.]
MRRHTAHAHDTQVYAAPAAFEAFIRGGGNAPLYDGVMRELVAEA